MVICNYEMYLLTVFLTVCLLLVEMLATPIKLPSHLTVSLYWHTMWRDEQLTCDDTWAKAVTLFDDMISKDGGIAR